MADKPQRRWFRFIVRTLLILVTVVAIPLAWVAKERRQSQREQQIAEELREHGVEVIMLGGPYDSLKLRSQNAPQGWWRDLARQVLGERIVVIKGKGATQDFKNLAPLAGLKNLQGLWLYYSPVNDLTPLTELTNLQTLSLHQTPVSDLRPLVGLKNLQGLALRSTPVSDLTPLAGLKNLELLELAFTPVSKLTPLAGLKNLKRLDLDYTQVSDLTPLAGLENLQVLILDGTPVNDLTSLVGITNLRWLSIHETQVTKEQVESLQRVLPNCRIDHDPFP